MRILGQKNVGYIGGVAQQKKVIAEFCFTKIKNPYEDSPKKTSAIKKKRWLSLWSQRFLAHFGYKTWISLCLQF